jgi:hypothetical protein
MRRIRPGMFGLAVALVATIGGLGPSPAGASTASTAKAAAPVAVAADSCTPVLGCSQIHNDSHTFVIIRPNWSCGGGTGSTGGPECTNGTSEYLFGGGGKTPSNQDWDTFRVDAGWCFRVKFYLPYRSWTVTYNRVGLGETWVKVENWATAVIQAQRAGACP